VDLIAVNRRTLHRTRTAALAAVLAALAIPAGAQALDLPAVPQVPDVPAVAPGTCVGVNSEPSEVSLVVSERATFCLLNKERTSHGLAKLKRNRRLDLASVRHARAMALRDYFAHGNFVGRIKKANYLQGARSWMLGENIAWGSGTLSTPAEIVDAWMHSPGHRANILRRGFHEIGIGISRGTPVRAYNDGATYATDFGTRG
jgi:uncharacterized protein YkwD